MKLVPNWKRILTRSYSMWSIYAGIALLVIPEAWFALTGWQIVSPYLSGYGGVALLAVGGLGRVIDQGIAPVALIALLLAFPAPSEAMDEALTPPQPAVGHTAFLKVAVPLVARWEGVKTTAYLDRIARPPVWTICYGETEGVQPGETRTMAECEDGLRRGLQRYRAGLHEYFTTETLATRLPPTRDAAFTSFAWNVGIAGAGRSTATRRLNDGNVRGACNAITWWDKAGGRVIRGLVNRRADEQRVCLEGLI